MDPARRCDKCVNIEYSIKHNHINCFKYFHQNGRFCDGDLATATIGVAFDGNLEMLKCLHENRCPDFFASQKRHTLLRNIQTTWAAASRGNLDCLKYAHENGCPWSSDTTSQAAHGGYLECLKYAHENGCPWDPRTTEVAAYGGHIDCLKYIYFNCQSVISHRDNAVILLNVDKWDRCLRPPWFIN
jgi:hypothetical protein